MKLRDNLINAKCIDCGNCCLSTEMIISENDIQLILNKAHLNLSRGDFIRKNSEGYFELKNVEGHCVFFEKNTKLCKIYEFRPQGCSFYPLIYDSDQKQCIYDKDCPRIHLFNLTKQEMRVTCNSIKKFLQEELKIIFSSR